MVTGRIKVLKPENISIGSGCTFSEGIFIDATERIKVGDFVRISPYVCIISGTLNLNDKYSERKHIRKPIIIEDGAWLATGSTILLGVRIGEGAVVAAGAVVIKDVEPYTLVAGIPAKFKKNLRKTRTNTFK